MVFEKYKLPANLSKELFFNLKNAYIFTKTPSSAAGAATGVLVQPTSAGLVPIVRSTRVSPRPAQVFPPFVHQLIDAVRSVSNMEHLEFNNALVEVFNTQSFAPTTFCSPALDLNPNSILCMVIAYRFTKNSSRYMLKFGRKGTPENELTTQYFLDHNSFVLYSYDTNSKYWHSKTCEQSERTIYGDQMVCLTLRLSETFIDYRMPGPRFYPTNTALVRASFPEYVQFSRLRILEANTANFEYPPIAFTCSSGDLIAPEIASKNENPLSLENVLLVGPADNKTAFFGKSIPLVQLNMTTLDAHTVYFVAKQSANCFKRIYDNQNFIFDETNNTSTIRAHPRIIFDFLVSTRAIAHTTSSTSNNLTGNKIKRSKMPLRIPASMTDAPIAVLFENIFGEDDMFLKISGAHSFYRRYSYGREVYEITGVFCSHVEVLEDGSSLFNLMRSSVGYSGPTEKFSPVDTQILRQLEECARQVFLNQHVSFNHIQLQLTDYLLSGTADEKFHSIKTQDVKTAAHKSLFYDDHTTTALAICSFYSREDVARVNAKTNGEMVVNGQSVFPSLVLKRKESAPIQLPASARVLLTPNSTVIIPLSTNRYYAWRIETPQVPPAMRLKRLSLTATQSAQLAQFCPTAKATKLVPGMALLCSALNTNGATEQLKALHALENSSPLFVDYSSVGYMTVNSGDLLEPKTKTN